ncbi:MAG: glycosyltransferase [Paracoccaceae bacterium]|nr:glycosyltransferase [Paracoccaceae bacterium]
MNDRVPAIAIGKNEGARFLRCLASLAGKVDPVIYVDSGSTDGSVEAARAAGAEVVTLDMSQPFTAARARNAGLDRLQEIDPQGAYVQFLDGDCELQDGWIETARAALDADDGLAVVCGRRRERFPDATIWNRLIDDEWDTPVGPAMDCGGDALIRRAALAEECYDPTVIAGEEPEMCYRMRKRGWRIERLDAEMTLHDAALTRLGQVWKRAERAGHAYAEGAAMHGREPEGFRMAKVRALWVWVALVLVTVLALVILILAPSLWNAGLIGILLLVWPLQVLRLRFQKGFSWEKALFLTFSKLPEAKGVLSFWVHRLVGRKRGLIDYKEA